MKNLILIAFTLLLFIGCKSESNNDSKSEIQTLNDKDYSPYVGDFKPIKLPDNIDRPLFGDTHLHSSWSTDAGMAGATLGPDEAYLVSRGEEVVSHSGLKIKLIRPLDFIVLADHAENLGLADYVRRSDPILLANKTGKRWHDMVKEGNGYDAFIEWARSDKEDLIKEPKMTETVWQKVVENADKYNKPGVFTAFHGFEWTSMPDGNNMHRVVIFRDGADKTSQVLPFSMYDSVDPEALWDYLIGYEEKTGGRVLAIPHNGNLSNGLMFDTETYTGQPLSKEYVKTRIKYEPLVEVTQIKGDGETHPLLSPDDIFADFENLDIGNLTGKIGKTPDMLPKEYARSALLEGLKIEASLGTNPYKFGMIGSTDAHNGLPTTREENNFNKAHFVEPSADRYKHFLIEGEKPELSIMVKDLGASGLAAVWAKENTRESIWDAMARKEVYATTGTRMSVRVFGGWNFEESDLKDLLNSGYKKGVPMGGDLIDAPSDKSPTFIIRGTKDPDGANLDRVQVIKGWLDKDGNKMERIYDVAVSDNRIIDKNGTCHTSVGNTVDLTNASYTNTIGNSQLDAYWTDPDFDAGQRAFYYIRVIEIPTPRWTAFDAVFFEVKMPDDTKMIVQDRAYTSPIWYSPKY